MSSIVVREDTEDRFRWDTITSVFDDNGDLFERFIINDDGTTKREDYVDGVLRFVEDTDLNPDGSQSDAKPWQLRGKEFDETGQLLASIEIRDDGVEILKDYENGMLRFVSETDLNPDGSQSEARPWQLRGKEFDETGQLLSSIEIRDDGVEILRDYENGQLLFVGETDLNPDGSQSDARSWQIRTTEYDENGQRLESFELRDNGVTVATQFENGIRSARIMEDRDEFGGMSDAEDWDTFIFIYDETGTLEARRINYDDGDVTVNLYDNGQNAVRLQIDGDNDRSWYLRETLYGEDGSVSEINTYATADDVPSDYDFLIDDMVFVA